MKGGVLGSEGKSMEQRNKLTAKAEPQKASLPILLYTHCEKMDFKRNFAHLHTVK